MTNKELSQAIRKELKSAGFTSKDYSIRVRDCLYDTSVKITVKNPLVKISEIEEITTKFEKIDYDERTMEILAGANTYIFCEYDYGIIEEAASALVPTAEMVLNNPKYDGHAIADNGTKRVHIMKYSDYEWTLAEFDKEKSNTYVYRPTYWIRSARDLAIAMFRFKNLGTIYA